jgi:hypothetical protein
MYWFDSKFLYGLCVFPWSYLLCRGNSGPLAWKKLAIIKNKGIQVHERYHLAGLSEYLHDSDNTDKNS